MPISARIAVPVIASTLILTACGGNSGTKEDTMEDQTAYEPVNTEPAWEPATTSTMEPEMGFQGHPLDDPESLLSRRVFYFDYDKSDIDEADRATIEAHAAYLAENPSATVTLEGHADERGTREYNVALGDRRAKSVEQFMTLIGAGNHQMDTISYGEERPASVGENEYSWSRNRRVEIIYQTR